MFHSDIVSADISSFCSIRQRALLLRAKIKSSILEIQLGAKDHKKYFSEVVTFCRETRRYQSFIPQFGKYHTWCRVAGAALDACVSHVVHLTALPSSREPTRRSDGQTAIRSTLIINWINHAFYSEQSQGNVIKTTDAPSLLTGYGNITQWRLKSTKIGQYYTICKY